MFLLASLFLLGQHTAAALAKALDKVLETDLSFLRASSQRISVHHSEANIKVAIPKIAEITDSLICADHLIYLVLQKAREKKIFKSADYQAAAQQKTSEQDNNEIFNNIKQAQDLSAKASHKFKLSE